MKKVFLTLIAILLLGTINVKAEESYNILIDENNNFTMTDLSSNPITDSSIAKYENNTLILGDGKYFNQIKSKHDFTMTSNNKGVYIKELTTKEGNTYLPINVNIDKLKVIDDETYIFKMDIGGNLLINNSKINSKENYEIKGYLLFTDSKIITTKMIMTRGKNDEGYGYKISNSKVKCGSQIYTQIGGAYINNSEIDTNSLYSREKFYIENSKVNCGYFTKQSGDYDTIIKDSTIRATKASPAQAYFFSGNLTLENSLFEAGSLSVSKGELSVNNSTVNLINPDGLNTSGTAYINKSVIVKNSKLSFLGSLRLTASNVLTSIKIEDSEVVVSDFNLQNCSIEGSEDELRFYVNNSKVTVNKGRSLSVLHGNTVFENSELDIIEKLIHSYHNLSIINCNGNFSGGVEVDNNLILKKSKLLFSNENSNYEQYSSLAIKNDLSINDSNVIFDNTKNNKKPVLIQGNIILDDKIVLIDQEKAKLKVKKLEDREEETTIYRNFFDDSKPIFSFTYENEEFSNYAKLATLKTATFKVKNGTWLDGTTDDIKIDYLYGEKIEVEKLPDQVKELLSSKMGAWSMDLNNLDPTKDLEIEFKYDLINPNTSNKIVLLLVFVVILVVVLRNKKIYKKEF